ncbi:MAG: UpxY family transcription antiterminator [Candidatus Acidiferrales bacterium]|jgi:transcription antitermination factor NusG
MLAIGKNNLSSSQLSWFAIRVKSRCEWAVADALRQKGYEDFLPLYWSRRRWSDRVKILQLPLFSGYLFCRFAPADRVPILSTPGVVLIVGSGKTPLPIDAKEVEAIRAAVNSGQKVVPWPHLEIGRTVRIEEGSLRGLEGVLLRFKGTNQLILGVQLLQRAVAVEVPENWVIPCKATGPAATAPRFA